MGNTTTAALKTDTFLPPIEKPEGLLMKLAYYFTRRQFGKVLTPLEGAFRAFADCLWSVLCQG